MENSEETNLDETGVKKIILQFEKRALKNQVVSSMDIFKIKRMGIHFFISNL